jgi:hypothetical protein
VTTLHGTDITLVGNDPSYAPLTQYALIRASDAVTAVSQWTSRAARGELRRHERPCGIAGDPELRRHSSEFHPDAAKRRPARPTAVHVSNFRRGQARAVPRRGVRGRAARGRRAPRARRRRPRPGRVRDASRAATRRLQDKVVFLGMRDALPELLAPADLFCARRAPRSRSASPRSKRWRAGTPVLATDVGGVPRSSRTA